jgi:preprotein translocase subunit SecD
MRERSTRVLLVFIVCLTVFSVFVAFPSDPKRYVANWIPLPEEDCIVDGICIGKGFNAFGLERREMRLGLDLRGGTRLVLEADISNQPDIDLDDAMDSAVDIVERRVNAFGVAESITERIGSNRIQVQLPGISAEEALEKIGRTAQLKFMELERDDNGLIVIDDPATGESRGVTLAELDANRALLENARFVPIVVVDENGVARELNGSLLDRGSIFVDRDVVGSPVLNFGMTDEGADLLAQATLRLSAPPQPIAFFLDDEPIRSASGQILAPTVQGQISDQGQITNMAIDDARTLSTLLRTGAFPVPLNVVQQDEVDATLGDEAVVHTVEAGLIAILIVMAFMVVYYRLPGALSALALFVYVSLTLAVFKLWPVTITSAGMAAFVLSVGMAVDANILIFERMKEELRLGRSLRNAIDAGFSRAWSSIRDSNISTVITCIILYWFGDQFGASLVKGFALTLALGVIVSMFSAITVTRTFLHALLGFPVMQHLWLFGSDVEEARQSSSSGRISPEVAQESPGS